MAMLARKFAKTALFASLLFISIRYIYGPLSLKQKWNQDYSLTVAEALGFRDIELFDVAFGSCTSAVAAFAIYVVLMFIFRHIHERQHL
ncbi:hypothetical protein [Trinickia sp.]|uniref:hypothetical protein n=1 Tax=Trinickia sp. TaxID=2571163 RepID=UPI003F823A74